ncbi:precorrin-3B synthase [Micromonospora peucetia]|uniref:precorrin-3B synthase n=1 Tax=Micromonospora peucetia TaxID=47871 RepID=UPI00225A8673|nr:precorrin-3B synthase [Micromonospora peucetia]MCX4388099.1 precorrin-3B synthase [Micromonospora peucetia]
MPVVSSPSDRSLGDRCPGALRAHQAADGLLVRVRLPGGRLTAQQLSQLAALARSDGGGTLELTSRGNVQLRGIPGSAAVDRVAAALTGAGLLPSTTHERVRNIVASPLSGLDQAGHADVRPLVAALDAALCGAGDLAGLSGRFLFALDDSRGDVTGLGADLCWTAGTGALLVAGHDVGLRVAADAVVDALIAAARAFLALCGGRRDVWRIADLPGASPAVIAALNGPHATAADPPHGDPPAVGPHPAGFVVAAAPLGRLTTGQADTIAALAAAGAADQTCVVTPWRTVVLAGPAPTTASRLAEVGLVVDPASPWVGVTACAGRPGCASALSDVHADAAAALAAAGPQPAGALPLHFAGCERCCGRPAAPAALAVAVGDGYRVVGPHEPHRGPLAERVAEARRPR